MERVQEFIETYNIHLLNSMYVMFTLVIVILGAIINVIEQLLPESVRQSFRYGKFAHKGKVNKHVARLEVPKSSFKHMYVFAFLCSMLGLFVVLKGLILHIEASDNVLDFLDFIAGGRKNRTVKVNSTCALIAIVLMTMQCTRRFYESNFVQIFSKKSKINLSHYIVGYLHYFGAVLAILINTEGFVRGTLPSSFSLSNISLLQYFCILCFHFCWLQQYKSNMILVNLRKDEKTGAVATERHLMPKGGFFEYISSPHMFFEIAMYVALIGILPKSTTWWLIAFWVAGNQTIVALLTHKWYKENYKTYPKQRRALIPFLF